MFKKKQKKNHSWFWLGAGAIGIIISVFLSFPQQIPPGVTLAGVHFEGLSEQQALEKLDELDQIFQEEIITFELDEHEIFPFLKAELGISYDISKTISELMGNQSLLSRILPSPVKATKTEQTLDFQPVIQIKEDVLSEALASLVSNHEKPAQDAVLEWEDGQWEITSEASGEELSQGELERLKRDVIEGLNTSQADNVYSVEYDIIPPLLTKEELEAAQKRLNSFLSEPIEINYGDETTQLSFLDQENWLPIEVNGPTISLNQKKLQQWIAKYSLRHNKKAGEVSITGVEEVESEYDGENFERAIYEGSFESGWEIDEEQLVEGINNAFEDLSMSRTIDVQLISISPKITSQIKELTFPDLLSVGKSSFEEGNYADRVKNISLSLGAFNTVIVPAGEEFSMNRTTGWITPDKGYTKTKVLYGGTVGYGIGGGVCQTSTTLYRAVINAGLEVTERRPHTLDVSYYHKYGYGIDAAVYTVARKDFQFVNDTGKPLLINSYITPNDEAIVEIYGTSDGRVVELENVPTGVRTYKKWNWLVKWPEKEEKRAIESKYLR